jgi:hypothetical protein
MSQQGLLVDDSQQGLLVAKYPFSQVHCAYPFVYPPAKYNDGDTTNCGCDNRRGNMTLICNGTVLGSCAPGLSAMAWLDLYGKDSGVASDALMCSYNLTSVAELAFLEDLGGRLSYTDILPGAYILASWEKSDQHTLQGFYYQVGPSQGLAPDLAWAAARRAKKPLVILNRSALALGRPPFQVMPRSLLPM